MRHTLTLASHRSLAARRYLFHVVDAATGTPIPGAVITDSTPFYTHGFSSSEGAVWGTTSRDGLIAASCAFASLIQPDTVNVTAGGYTPLTKHRLSYELRSVLFTTHIVVRLERSESAG